MSNEKMIPDAMDEELGFVDWWDSEYDDDPYYTPSSTAGDSGPGNPWDAPGMSIRDFL